MCQTNGGMHGQKDPQIMLLLLTLSMRVSDVASLVQFGPVV